MATRKTILATGEIYHVFNRSIAKQPIFQSSKSTGRFLHAIDFYRFQDIPSSFSKFIRLEAFIQAQLLQKLHNEATKSVTIFVFAIMPNHFHFLLRQECENGIKKFMSQIQ